MFMDSPKTYKLSTFRVIMMPPSPNNTVENSPRPSRPIDDRSKRKPLPVQTDRTFPTGSIPQTSSSNGSINMMTSSRRRLHDLINTANFSREVERLKTFEGWRVPFLTAGQMAAAGFYYTKRDDVVRCAFCGVEVGSWEEGDNPMHDHQRWSPACRFLQNLPVGNVPISAENSSAETTPVDNGYDVCGPGNTGQYGIMFRSDNTPETNDIPSIEKLGIQQSRPPAFPSFATYDARMRSYEMWPISLKLKPNVLSEAGFFYTGKGDQTICYHCGGGLKDWEESDEPWEEHARWFNKCNFVLLVKGKEFVDKVAVKRPEDSKTMFSSGTSSNLEEKSPDSTHNNGNAVVSKEAGCSNEKKPESEEMEENVSGNMNSDSRLCKICFQEEMGVVFLPCGHIVACPKCALSLTTCAVCRKPFTATIRAFLS